MKLRFKMTFSDGGHAASILALAITVCSLLYPSLQPYRLFLLVAAIVVAAWVAYLLRRRLQAIKELRKKETVAPTVLLVGGPEFAAEMESIKSSTRLSQEPYIEFKAVDLDVKMGTREQEQKLSRAVAQADALILMPDFTVGTYPEGYRLLVEECDGSPVPIARYYPRSCNLERTKDSFQVLPFHSPEDIVEYSSEFLLKRAVDRGRLLQTRIRLSYVIASGAVGCFLISLIFGSFALKDLNNLELLKKTLVTPPAIQQEIAQKLARFRAGAPKSDLSESEKARIQGLLADWIGVETSEIGRIFASSQPVRLQLFALSPDGKNLEPIAESGYTISAQDSIAGCAFYRRLAVYWRGKTDQTIEIEAWDARGDHVGQFDELTKTLVFDNSNYCKFDNRRKKDAKQQILCMPIAADESNMVETAPGVACIVTDEPAGFMTEEWIRSYFSRQLSALGTVDLQRLLPPTPGDRQGQHDAEAGHRPRGETSAKLRPKLTLASGR